MKLCLKMLAIAAIAASTYSLIGCAAPAGFSYQNVGISLIATQCGDCNVLTFNPAFPQPTTIPNTPNSILAPGTVITAPAGGGSQGGCIYLNANVTNAPPNLTWAIYPSPNLTLSTSFPSGTSFPPGESGSFVGTINDAVGLINYYCIPGTPPVYTGAALQQAQAMGIPQGDVELVVSTPNNPSNPSSVATFSTLFQVYVVTPNPVIATLFPSTPKGQTNSAVTITHGTTYQFNGFVVGAPPCLTASACGTLPLLGTDNSVIWEVGSSPTTAAICTTPTIGPSCPNGPTWGTISPTGLYTAPASASSSPPVVVLVSHLTQSITATAYITIN